MTADDNMQEREQIQKDKFDKQTEIAKSKNITAKSKTGLSNIKPEVSVVEGVAREKIAKVAWNEFDLFMFGFTTVSAFTFVGVALALLAVIVLDIRWLLGHLSAKVPLMPIYLAMFLGVLNMIVFIIFLVVMVVGLLLTCAATNSAGLTVRTIGLALGFDTQILNACF